MTATIPKERRMTTETPIDQQARASELGSTELSISRLSRSPRAVRLALHDDPTPLPISLVAAALCLTVGLVHLQDQGGFLGNVTPEWMAIGYYAVEVGAAITIPFIIRQKIAGPVLAALVSIGPFVGYILSRSVGLPGDPGDVGNWGYTLGTVSLVVEGMLFLLSLSALLRAGALKPWRR
jgi:hypothetical protein